MSLSALNPPGIGGYDLMSPADRILMFDYTRSGAADHFLLYRPGTGKIYILHNTRGTFTPVYKAETGGIGGYDLADPADQIFAFDYDSSGYTDHLVLYRPGAGKISILKNTGGVFTAVYSQETGGIGGFDLSSPVDHAFAYDFDNSGLLNHLVFYRPGQRMIWILSNNGGNFQLVFGAIPGTGIAGYDLASPADLGFALDYVQYPATPNALALYRPGKGAFYIIVPRDGVFIAAYAQGDPGSGIGQYDLKEPQDRAFAFDYESTGFLSYIVLYRPGRGAIFILRQEGPDSFSYNRVYDQGDPGSGIAGYDLADPNDQVMACDYLGTGKDDHLCLYRPGTGIFWIVEMNGGSPAGVYPG